MTPETLTLAERIKIARLRASLDQADVAAAIGVSRPLVSKWERGESSPDLNQKIKLARLLTQPLDIFCTEDDLVDLRTALEVGIRGPGGTSDQGILGTGWLSGIGPEAHFRSDSEMAQMRTQGELVGVR